VKSSLGSLITAVATPFRSDGEIDREVFERLVRYLADHGSDAVVVSGSTGESGTLTDDEKIELVRLAKSTAPSLKVISGTTTNSTKHSLELVERAERAGADGILAVTPYYNRPSQEGLVAHFSAILSSTSLPVILYDIPIRTGRKIETSTVLALLERFDNLYGLKDASQTTGQAAALLRLSGENLSLFSGDDALTLPLMSVGAVGVISVASHWAGPVFKEMIESFKSGDNLRAAKLNLVLVPSFNFQSQDFAPNPTPLKAMLEVMGFGEGICRLPLLGASKELKDQAKELLDRLVLEAKEAGVYLEERWEL
jgi:4-hydroxy-tetrahydrodipicolinate synthase